MYVSQFINQNPITNNISKIINNIDTMIAEKYASDC